MKKSLIILLLIVCATLSVKAVQKYILTKGTNGYVTVTVKGEAPQDFTRGTLMTEFYISPKGDTQMGLNFCLANISSFIPPVADTNWQNGDASNGNFPNADSLYRWTRRNLQKYVGN